MQCLKSSETHTHTDYTYTHRLLIPQKLWHTYTHRDYTYTHSLSIDDTSKALTHIHTHTVDTSNNQHTNTYQLFMSKRSDPRTHTYRLLGASKIQHTNTYRSRVLQRSHPRQVMPNAQNIASFHRFLVLQAFRAIYMAGNTSLRHIFHAFLHAKSICWRWSWNVPDCFEKSLPCCVHPRWCLSCLYTSMYACRYAWLCLSPWEYASEDAFLSGGHTLAFRTRAVLAI